MFEIEAARLRPEKYATYVYTDLVEPRVAPPLYDANNQAILKQVELKDAAPWIVVTLLYIPFAGTATA